MRRPSFLQPARSETPHAAAPGGRKRGAGAGQATLDGPRQARKNAAARKRYAARRAAGRCTDCGAPSQGAARCQGCAERSYHRSDHFRGIPVWPARFTVIELATETCHGVFDSEAEVAACLAFAKLSRDQVEIVPDTSPMARPTGWT